MLIPDVSPCRIESISASFRDLTDDEPIQERMLTTVKEKIRQVFRTSLLHMFLTITRMYIAERMGTSYGQSGRLPLLNVI